VNIVANPADFAVPWAPRNDPDHLFSCRHHHGRDLSIQTKNGAACIARKILSFELSQASIGKCQTAGPVKTGSAISGSF